MTTDNRTNEPTPEQVEAAAKAMEEHRHVMVAPGPHRCSCGYVLDGWAAAHKLHAARAALEAAARAAHGAAPQAESSPTSSYINPSLPGMIRNLWKSDPSENSVRTALKLAGDLIQELIDLRAATVLPSSGVDEDKLAEVIGFHRLTLKGQCACGHALSTYGTRSHDPEEFARHIARAVAEWLKGGAR